MDTCTHALVDETVRWSHGNIPGGPRMYSYLDPDGNIKH